MAHQPIKRVEEMQGVSRDHHHALLLAFKINKGIGLNIAPDRIRKYILWFREEHLVPHFIVEEKWMFPILGEDNEKVQQALSEHKRLLDLSKSAENYNTMHDFAEELKAHIRFEERDLFQDIQANATQEELENIQKHHTDYNFVENTTDVFWK
ncbi:hemerythrin domain-containing protein [Flavobacteriaceae bacterium Ap0902]|nr:hemerythrin domain-containing protein [Flavobacteriaceae bacterium Ap0902]